MRLDDVALGPVAAQDKSSPLSSHTPSMTSSWLMVEGVELSDEGIAQYFLFFFVVCWFVLFGVADLAFPRELGRKPIYNFVESLFRIYIM